MENIIVKDSEDSHLLEFSYLISLWRKNLGSVLDAVHTELDDVAVLPLTILKWYYFIDSPH